MVLIPADVLDVIERIGAMTKKALIHGRVLLTCDHFVHHDEMFHIVTRGGLMALRTFFRRGRRMEKA